MATIGARITRMVTISATIATMVTTIVAAVRTFHSETKQDHATLAVASVRVPATQITNMGARLVTHDVDGDDDGGWHF